MTTKIGIACVSLLLAALGWFVAPTPREWPMTDIEEQAAAFQEQNLALIADGVARVSSGDKATDQNIRKLIVTYGHVVYAERALGDAAAKRCGVAVVRSGSTWVRRG